VAGPGSSRRRGGHVAAKRVSGADQLYGFARHDVETRFLASSNGVRRRYTQPTGTVEINGKRDGASARVGFSTPVQREPA
jgi:predicted Zn-dependent protease